MLRGGAKKVVSAKGQRATRPKVLGLAAARPDGYALDMARVPPIQRLPKVVQVGVLLVSVVLPLYWALTYSGLYRWLAEVQLDLLGSYYVMLTGLISGTAVLCVLVFPLALLSRLFEKASRDGGAHAPAAPDSSMEEWVLANRGLFVAVLTCIGLAGTTLYFQVRAATLGDLHSITLESLEAGTEPPSYWVNVEGQPSWSETLSLADQGHAPTYYVPMRSGPSRGPALLLELRHDRPSDRRAWTGTLNTAPGPIRSAVEDPNTQSPVWVLEVDSFPAKLQLFANMFGAMTLCMLAMLGGFMAWRRRRRG